MTDSRYLEIDKLQYLMMMQNWSLKHVGRPPSWIIKLTFITGWVHLRDTFCFIIPNFVALDHTVAEISQFFMFFKWKVKIHQRIALNVA